MIHPAEIALRERDAAVRALRGAHRDGRIVLAGEPRITQIATPKLTSQMAGELDEARALLAASPMRFDGHIWLVGECAPDRITVFAASYAWLFCPSLAIHPGPLCIGIDITDRRGRRLIQWANPDRVVAAGPRLAVGGFVDVDEHPREAALREAKEELGLATNDLQDLRACHAQRAPVGILVIYRAHLAPGATTQLGDEVERLAWISAEQTPRILGPDQAALL